MIFRSKERKQFTRIPQSVLNIRVFTLEELGLYTAMLSKPNNWEFSEYVLSRDFHTTPDDIHRVLKRLELKGFVRERPGRNGRVWDLYEESSLCGPNALTCSETALKNAEPVEAPSEESQFEAEQTAPKSDEKAEEDKRTLTNEQMASVFFEKANELRRIRDEYRKTHVWP